MTEPASHIESFGRFIELEQERYSGKDSNTLGLAFSQLNRYLRFLQIVKKDMTNWKSNMVY